MLAVRATANPPFGTGGVRPSCLAEVFLPAPVVGEIGYGLEWLRLEDWAEPLTGSADPSEED